MDEKYIYNGKVYSRADLEKLAAQSEVSFDEYISGIGAKPYTEETPVAETKKTSTSSVSGTYLYNNKEYQAADLQKLAQESGVGFDEYITGIGAKKKSGGTPSNNGTSNTSPSKSVSEQPSPANIAEVAVPSMIGNLIPAFKGKTFGQVAAMPEVQENLRANARPLKINESDVETLKRIRVDAGVTDEKLLSTPIPSVISNFIPSIAGKTFGEVVDSDEGRYVQVQIAKKNIQDKINKEIAKFYKIAQKPNKKIIAENKKKLEEISSIETKLALNLTKIADKEESAVVRTDESGNNLKRFMNFLGRYGQITGYVPTPEASDKITNLPSQFFTSLNYMGYKDPVAAARISKSLAEGKPISASQVATMVNMGIDIEREKLKDKLESGEIQQEGYVKAEQEFQVKSKENLLGNQEVLRAFLSSGIADIADSIEVSKEVSTPADPLNLFTKIFGHRWNYTDAEIAEYGRKVAAVNGLDPNDARVKDAIKYLQDNEGSLIFENSIYKAGWTRDLAKGLAQPIRGIAASIDDVSKNLTDNENDIYVEGQSQGNVLVAEQPTKRVENSWVGTVGKIVEGAGQFITQAGMSYLGGGLFSGIGGLGVRGREIISTLITAGSQSFDSNLKSAMNYTSEDGVAYGVAGGLSFLEGAVENILSPTQVARGIASKFIRGDKATREVINILTDSKIVDKQSVLSKYFNGSIRGILSAGKVAGGEVSEESITEIADFTAQMILNPNSQSFEDRSLWEGLVTTAHETGLSMAIPALLTGVGSANVNNFTKGALISAAQNRLKMIEALDERKAEGGLTDKEYNEKVQLINTAADVNDNLPLKADGTKLNTQEKADYVYSRTAEAVLNKRLQQVNDEAEKSVINDKIKEQQNFRTSILKNEGNQTAQTTEGENAKTATPESNDSEATTRTTPTTNITGELAVGDVIKNKDGELGRVTAINDNEITVADPNNPNQVSSWAKDDVDRSNTSQTQQPKIESAVIEIGGKIYEGKNHAEAILKAQSDGQDISTVDRNGQGKFKLSDGSIIDRAQAKSQFGQDRSELLIPQDEAADNANKEYAAITSANTKPATSPLTKEAEDLLASLGEGSLPTFITKNLEKIASDNGITITDQMSASDVVNSLREKQTAPQVTTPVTDIPAEAKSKFEAFKNKRQANANQQQSGAVRNETETQIPEGQSDSNLPSSNETQLQNREETETETLTPEDKTFVKEAFDNDLIPSFAKPAISTDGEFDESKAEGFLQELASQSQGIALDGTPLAGGGQDMVARGYPKQLVDLANEKYPLNEGTTTEVNQPIQQNEPTAQEQGTESAVQQSPDATGQIDAGTGNAVLEENKPTISKEQPSETQGNASTPQLGEAVVVNDNDNQNIDNENENTNNTTPIISLSEIKTIEDKGTGAESSNDQAKAAEVIAQVDEILEADKRVSPDEIARQNGEKNVNGTVVKRQNPITAVLGNAVDILFSKSDKQPARYAVVERSDIQPSHKSGIKNETHFIPEAQPRDRGSLEVLKNEAKAKADVLDPNQLAENNIAFFGSPIINSRGEVIQGNGRAEALDYYYDNNKSDSKGYKAMVAAKAKALGLDAAAIANMNEPVLVRLADVNDERAIVLGNYTSSDLEDVKQKDADAKAAIGKLKPAQLVELSNAISSRTSETDTLRTAIRDNAKSIIDILMDVGALRNDNREQYINSTGVTPEGIESAYNVVKQLLFEGGDAELSAKFNNLSFTQREAIEKTIPAILSNKELKQHVQNVIEILHEKTESAEKDFDTWAKQSDMFNGGKAPMESYDRNDIALAKSIDNSKTQKEISTTIKQLAQDMTDVPATLFEAERKGLNFNEAATKTLPAFQVTTPVSEDVSEMVEIVRELADGTRTLEDIQAIAQAELGNLYDANVVEDAFIELGKETATTPTEVEMVTTGVLGQVGKWMNSLFGASSRPRVFIAKNSERMAAKVKELGGAVRFMINENNNLSLPKIKQYVEDIFTGKAVFERFSPQEQRGFIEGGRIHAEASLILAGNERPNEQAESSNEEQEKSIEKYAKENGIWVENVNEKYGEPHNGGEESIVWGNAEKQTVTKSQNTFLYNNLQEKLDGITLHNTYFPEAPIKVIGFGRNSEGHFQVIVEQPFIKGDSTKITSQEIQDYLTKLGLERNEENNYSTPQILLEDLHTGNAIKTPEGNIIVIDPIMRLNTPEQGYGGTRVVSNSLNVSNDNGSQISFMQSPEGEILGFKHDGKIYLNGERLNANTPIHEAGHLWIEWAKDKSKKLYDKGMELVSAKGNRYLAKVKATPFYQTEAKKLGKEGSKAYENYMKEEALAMAIGDKGAQFVVESRRKTFTDWMKQLFDAVGRVVGISNVKNIEDLTFDQFTKAVAAEILQGGENVIPPTTPVEADGGRNESSFEDAVNSITATGEVKEYISGKTIVKYTGENPTNVQNYTATVLDDAFKQGENIIQAAKDSYGKSYVSKIVEYIEGSNIPVSDKALIYVSLRNDLYQRRMEATPEQYQSVVKEQEFVYEKSQAFAHQNAVAMSMWRLQNIQKFKFNSDDITAALLSDADIENKGKLEKAVQADDDAVNSEFDKGDSALEITGETTVPEKNDSVKDKRKKSNKSAWKAKTADKGKLRSLVAGLKDKINKLNCK